MKLNSKERGFTIIELMIVVAIIVILVAVAYPRFIVMLEKAREGATKANLATLKSAINIYYNDQAGIWPSDLTGSFKNYLDKIPAVKVTHAGYGPTLSGKSTAILIETVSVPAAIGSETTNDGWKYNNVTGDIWVNNSMTDSNGVQYSMYGHE